MMRFKVRECPVVDYDRVYEAILIVLEDLKTGKLIEICDYSEFLLDEQRLNLEKNTRLEYAKAVKVFLNHIFFDCEFFERSNKSKIVKNLDVIENLTIEDGELFLNDYKYGRIGKAKLKSRGSVILYETILTAFYDYLIRNYNMKKINKNKLTFGIHRRKSTKNRELRILQSPFKITYPSEKDSNRLEDISFYAIIEFVALALEHYPMIALAIALQAFAGLRKSEVTCTSFNNIRWSYLGEDLRDFRIDLKIKQELRSDGVDTGQIKSHEIAHIHPAFLELFKLIFERHLKYLNDVFTMKNKYGALFMNRYGKAMTERNYEYAFNELTEMLIENLKKTGNSRAIREANMMRTYDFTTHTLRYFFSQYIARLPGTNIFDIAMFRRDKSLESAINYIKNNPYIVDDRIKAMQDKE